MNSLTTLLDEVRRWHSPLPDPPGIAVLFAVTFSALLMGCLIYRSLTVGYWNDRRRGTLGLKLVLACLFLVGAGGVVTMVRWIH